VEFRLEFDRTQLVRVLGSLHSVRTQFGQALRRVNPEFGAYMPYSSFQEEGRRDIKMRFNPHLLPAILNNAGWITQNMAFELRPALSATLQGRVNLNTLKAQIRRAWEVVLNGKPREDAIANAPEEFGFHKMTIRGYGDERSEGSIRAQQQKLMRERAYLERYANTATARRIRRRLAAFRTP